MIQDYESFLASKAPRAIECGFEIDSDKLSKHHRDFQGAITRWALRLGRCAIFADCGLGKGLMALDWSRLTSAHTKAPVIIVAPLSVSRQFVREGEKFGIPVNVCRDKADVRDGLNVTNYERIEKFDPSKFGGVALDESSILKGLDSKTRDTLTEMFKSTPYRLCCTATPAPNDHAELGNHSEFLGIATRVEMLATFFVHDENGWRLKGHAQEAFYEWLSSWAMSLKSPADIGFDGSKYVLPELSIEQVTVGGSFKRKGEMFGAQLKGITDRTNERKATVDERVAKIAELVRSNNEQWVVWCGLNDESAKAVKAIGDGCVEVSGAMSAEEKEARAIDFIEGKTRVLVTKADIFGFGMNFQHCHNTAFLGLSDSYESYYQCIRRFWRYGQTKPVKAAIVVTDAESAIVENVKRKEADAEKISRELVTRCALFEKRELGKANGAQQEYAESERRGENWFMLLGDCVKRVSEIEDETIDLSVFSPPFISLYTYSATARDMGNSRDENAFYEHFGFLIRQLLRVIKPGRICAVHVSQVPAMLGRDGFIGLKDFRGDVIRQFIGEGFVYHGEVCIDKDPQAQAIRTKAKGLLFVQGKKDSSWLRPALADYILLFRKPGENPTPIPALYDPKTNPDGWITNDEWIQWARPIWYGIRESETLNAAEGRDNKDDKHIAPLQLDTIHRCVMLWSAPGEIVLSPFGGIGSEGYQSILDGRKYVGIELKPSYFNAACKNLERAEAAAKRKEKSLFANMETPQ